MLKTILLSSLFLVTFTFLGSSPVLSQFYDGKELVQLMQEYEKAQRSDPSANMTQAAFYSGFVLGICDSVSSSLCPSVNVTAGRVSTVVAQYINNHPSEWGKPAYELVLRALSATFSCK